MTVHMMPARVSSALMTSSSPQPILAVLVRASRVCVRMVDLLALPGVSAKGGRAEGRSRILSGTATALGRT
ncbi:hypothetical protein GCM10009819_00730 [Agromyces tropicus]|uniref:Uncharacterized protein n=1 Tax=Agromyces tropicus TaxID=555371 RepID=A0ABN2TW33_9MICO